MSGASGKGLNNVFMQLRKVCNHPYLFFDDRWPSDMVSEIDRVIVVIVDLLTDLYVTS